jgi:hypothetical protein
MWQPAVVATGLAIALMSSVIPYQLELEALRRVPARVFGIWMSLEPAVAALVGLLILGEALAGRQWLAIVCVTIACAGDACGGGAAAPGGQPRGGGPRAAPTMGSCPDISRPRTRPPHPAWPDRSAGGRACAPGSWPA